jgi:hypothetical protein
MTKQEPNADVFRGQRWDCAPVELERERVHPAPSGPFDAGGERT